MGRAQIDRVKQARVKKDASKWTGIIKERGRREKGRRGAREEGAGGRREEGARGRKRLSTGSSPVGKDAMTSGFVSDLFTQVLEIQELFIEWNSHKTYEKLTTRYKLNIVRQL